MKFVNDLSEPTDTSVSADELLHQSIDAARNGTEFPDIDRVLGMVDKDQGDFTNRIVTLLCELHHESSYELITLGNVLTWNHPNPEHIFDILYRVHDNNYILYQLLLFGVRQVYPVEPDLYNTIIRHMKPRTWSKLLHVNPYHITMDGQVNMMSSVSDPHVLYLPLYIHRHDKHFISEACKFMMKPKNWIQVDRTLEPYDEYTQRMILRDMFPQDISQIVYYCLAQLDNNVFQKYITKLFENLYRISINVCEDDAKSTNKLLKQFRQIIQAVGWVKAERLDEIPPSELVKYM